MHPTMHLLYLEAERGYRAVVAERERQIALAIPAPRVAGGDRVRTWVSGLSRIRRVPGGQHALAADRLSQPTPAVALARS